MSITGVPKTVTGYTPSVGANVSSVPVQSGSGYGRGYQYPMSRGRGPVIYTPSQGQGINAPPPSSGGSAYGPRRQVRRAKSQWDHHVQKVRKAYPKLSFRDALILASKTYA